MKFLPGRKSSPVGNHCTTTLIFPVKYPFGFLGEMSTGKPGRGMSMGNISTHNSRRPCDAKTGIVLQITFTDKKIVEKTEIFKTVQTPLYISK